MPWSRFEPEWPLRFLRSLSVAAWSAGPDGSVFDVTEWAALTGQTAEEAVGDGWMAVVHPDDRDRVSAAWRTAVAHGSVYNTDYRLRCSDGIYRWYNARGLAVLEEAGDPIQWIGAMLPIAGAARPSRTMGTQPSQERDCFTEITPAALRAARGILNWSASDLAQRASLSRSTIRRIEENSSSVAIRPETTQRILNALIREGVNLIGDNGVVNGVQMKPESTSSAI